MAYLLYEQITVDPNTVMTIADLNPPTQATSAELQADNANINYTMDGSTDPEASSGMVLLTTEPPREFLIEDIQNIRFIILAGQFIKMFLYQIFIITKGYLSKSPILLVNVNPSVPNFFLFCGNRHAINNGLSLSIVSLISHHPILGFRIATLISLLLCKS